jgi:hypothetical protein
MTEDGEASRKAKSRRELDDDVALSDGDEEDCKVLPDAIGPELSFADSLFSLKDRLKLARECGESSNLGTVCPAMG